MKTPIENLRGLILDLDITYEPLLHALDYADEQFEEAIIQAHTHMRCVDRQHESYECTLEALDKARDYYTKTYGNSNGTNRLLADVVDSLEFIADSLSEEALLR